VVDPIFRVILFFFVQGRLLSREAIRTTVLVGRDVHQLEVKEENCSDPAVNGGIWLDIGVAEQAFNVACIHFNSKIVDADEVEAHHA
jgi:hypothetical protein